jgi:general secretion pathway protein B
MSYILDALKKADKERKRGMVPNLSSDQDPSPRGPKKRSVWLYILIVALLINGGFFLFWWSPWETKDMIIVAETTAVNTEELPVTAPIEESPETISQAAPVSLQAGKTIPPKPITDKEKKQEEEQQSTISPQEPVEPVEEKETTPTLATNGEDKDEAKDKEITDISSKQLQAQEPESLPPSTTMSVPSKEQATSDSQEASPRSPNESPLRIYDFKTLPASVKQDLPDINISVFVYSDDPASRVVKINGQTVREGQELDNGLIVEKIVPEGVIFNYDDYRFRVVIR